MWCEYNSNDTLLQGQITHINRAQKYTQYLLHNTQVGMVAGLSGLSGDGIARFLKVIISGKGRHVIFLSTEQQTKLQNK